MDTILLPQDFKEFLQLLNSNAVEYLLIDGVAFAACFAERIRVLIDNIEVPLISRHHLLQNKKASGRHKDLEDIKQLSD